MFLSLKKLSIHFFCLKPICKGDNWKWRVFLGLWTLFWLRLGLWRVILTWSVCMLFVRENTEMYEYQKETSLFCFFLSFFVCFMAVLLSEAQTEIPKSLEITVISPSSIGTRHVRKSIQRIHNKWEENKHNHIMFILPVLFLTKCLNVRRLSVSRSGSRGISVCALRLLCAVHL